VIARTSGEAAALGAQVRKVVRDLEPDLPVHRLATLRAAQERTWWQERMVGALVAFGSVTTLVLAMVGLYALVTQDVLRRTREIGVRLAIGAAPGAVVALVLRRGVRLTIAGLTVGTIAAVGAGRLLRGLLQGVGAGDGPVFAGAAAALLLVAGLACWLPARRAARIDAMTALRAE
jgi:ABC-type antimicrobial peptide transport system permease subunit